MSGWGSICSSTTYALRNQSAALARLQEQISSGIRVSRASDAPSDALKIMCLHHKSASLEGCLSNLDQASRVMETSLNAMQQISTSLSRVRELLTQANSGTYNDANRRSMAAEIDSLLDQAFSLANTSSLGQYSFAGQSTTTQPYVAQRVEDTITSVQYVGSLEQMYVPALPGTNIASQVVGSEAFGVSDRETPELLGSTGAAIGTSPSTVSGDLWLKVEDGGTTTYDPATGLVASASAAQDTIVGLHTITIDAIGSTIRLDNGAIANFTGAEADLELTNAAGQSVHMDMTGWAGADGQWQVSRSVELSLGDGSTTTTVTDFSAEAAVVDPQTGGVLMVDPSGISAVGRDSVTVPGSHDLFGTLIHIRNVLKNTMSLDPNHQQEVLLQANDSLSSVSSNLTQQMAAVGSRLQAMDAMTTSIQTNRNSADDQAAMLQDADIVQLATELAKNQNLYEMTLASASKLLSLSLMDFLR